ncbi:hypothetical protein [Dysgonomonas sp. GY617]|uniref:GP88 family protein n=1 Tax=Dysgonomonas sp. GY617 TaxID=2780420 RepID=UPI00188415E4|nr:hypothetical protein [Dysgonomonas sp. GY617]MBF0578183.1 hypothetical protein [Dysgonomonas sp. GY617]
MTPNQIKKQLGISYLGGCNSPKLIKSKDRNVMTYGVYLAPHTLSGYNVCPESLQCQKYCLHGSGRNKIELLTNKEGGSIQNSRIKKTKLFFEDRRIFMQLLEFEIRQAYKKSKKENMQFAVRLNCTSDINLEEFTINEENILQLFPDVQFYDYTKVYNHTALTQKYKNYDLTFSYSGDNWAQCEVLLKKGYRVAVVFQDSLPEQFRGYSVINAVEDDARFLDAGGIICGLTYKKVANDYTGGKFQKPDTVFITKEKDAQCIRSEKTA